MQEAPAVMHCAVAESRTCACSHLKPSHCITAETSLSASACLLAYWSAA
jgi:hypothetical protein